ncbi:MAG: hypothetical protein UY27_C0029G0006, partial [Candidatus Gottesmanbacteria bacterium GW2011_GWA1_48_13]
MKKRSLVINTILLFICLGGLILTFMLFNNPDVSLSGLQDEKTIIAAKVAGAQEKTSTLKKVSSGPQTADSQQTLKTISSARKRELLTLMKKSPADVVRIAMTPGERSQLPPEVQSDIEENKTIAGKLDVNIVQDPIDKKPKTEVILITPSGEKYAAHLSGDIELAHTGGKAIMSGTVIDNQMAVVSSSLGQAKEGAFTSPRFSLSDLENTPTIAALNSPRNILAATASIVPSYYQTSEFMLGTVAVGLVMPQCNGQVDKCAETWSAARMDNVYNQVRQGLDWWVAKTGGKVNFIIDQYRQIPTSYEPVNRPMTDQALWISEVTSSLGYPGATLWQQVYAFNNALRQKHKSDWATTIFVVDSNNNSQGAFSNGYFAYAYVPGPFMVMTYDNNGYGINNMAAVAAHETGHLFGALDQYPGAGVACTQTSGYLALQTQNSQQNCLSNVGSIMRGGLPPYTNNLLDQYAAGQLGLRISSNALPDPINTKPKVVIDPLPSPLPSNLVVTGTAEDQPFTAPSGNSITINNITQVQYRLDGGSWQTASTGGDGIFNQVTEKFTFSPWLSSGTHLIEIQATNRVNNLSDLSSLTVTIGGNITPSPSPITTPTPTATPIPTPTITPTPLLPS